MRCSYPCLTALMTLTLFVGTSVCSTAAPGFLQGEKRIAVTIDDLPLNGPHIDLARLQTMTGKLLSGFKQNRIPVVGFVNESLLYVPGETDARVALLKSWLDAGVELGNHTFSHMGFKDHSLAAYEDDFIRGEAVTRLLTGRAGARLRYFRHPFLQMGPTEEIEKSFEHFIADRGYGIAPVTMDSLDWLFLSAYADALGKSDPELRNRVSMEYLKYVALKLEFCERAAADLFGHQITHILLLHANELNADNIDGLVNVFKSRGYQFVTLEEALMDPVYRSPEKYLGTSDWLGAWAFSLGRKLEPPQAPGFIQKVFEDAQKRASTQAR
jgi:peptidoglycan-N-acetylglucosamine deacetylase